MEKNERGHWAFKIYVKKETITEVIDTTFSSTYLNENSQRIPQNE